VDAVVDVDGKRSNFLRTLIDTRFCPAVNWDSRGAEEQRSRGAEGRRGGGGDGPCCPLAVRAHARARRNRLAFSAHGYGDGNGYGHGNDHGSGPSRVSALLSLPLPVTSLPGAV